MRFIETPIFTKAIVELLDDDDWSLQTALLPRPPAGRRRSTGEVIRREILGRAGGGKQNNCRCWHEFTTCSIGEATP
jgi:hypothetical protein